MAQQLKDKIALITGGSSGIGRAAAQLFTREGAKVVIADINVSGGQETVQLISAAGGEAHFIKTDISESSQVESLVNKTIEIHGRLDCAFNNAGITGGVFSSVVDHTEETWDLVLKTNLKGTWLCMKYEIPHMLNQGCGAIVNTSSTSGLMSGGKYRCAYSATKAAIVSLTKIAALEYSEYGVRVNVLCPSVTRTPLLEEFFQLNPEIESDFIAQTPRGRIGTAEEVAQGALWLCSDASSHVTGHAMAVDGGFLCR